MRKRRILYAAALGLALAVAIPGVASAAGTQNLNAGFAAKNNATITFGQPADTSKTKGTLRVDVFIDGAAPPVPAADTTDIDFPSEMKFVTKGLKVCDPASIEGLDPAGAVAECGKAQVGQGAATAFALPAGPVNAFNGPKVNGNPSIVLHSFAGNVPIVLVGELQNSPLGAPYGKRLHVPVSTTVGGGVPPGIAIVDFDTTVSAKIKSKKKNRADTTAAKKKKKKKTYVSVKKCSDGTLSYASQFVYSNAPTATPTYEQPCS